MEDAFQDGEDLVEDFVYDVENGLAFDTDMENPWEFSVHGYDSRDRAVEVRGLETNYYEDAASFARANSPPGTLMDLVGSSRNQATAAHLELVPYVNPVDVEACDTEKGNSNMDDCDKESAKPIAMIEPTGAVLIPAEDDQNPKKSSGSNMQTFRRAHTWDDKVRDMEGMVDSFRVMKDYAGKLEQAMYKIALVACIDGPVSGSVGSLIPSEILEAARVETGVFGVVMPAELRLQYDCIGITCQERYSCTFGPRGGHTASITACVNPTCSQNRYPNAKCDAVWNLTRWIEKDATETQLSVCWYDPGLNGVRALNGFDVKGYIQGNDYGVEMLAGLTNVIRGMEGLAYDVDKSMKTRHYVNHQWATMVTSGLLAGDDSLRLFFTPKPSYRISASSTVIVPICLKEKWSCYAFDFNERVVTIMDTNLSVRSTKDFVNHHKTANILLAECVRCMRELDGNEMAGTGEWRGKMLLPRIKQNVQLVMSDSFWNLVSCMVGFNEDYVCAANDELSKAWTRRRMAYSLMQIAGYDGLSSILGNISEATGEIDRGSETGGKSY